ncbi:MAG: NAD(P)(+) transhydrogenase (Re/Si-specific) subunit alpha, partial [Gaiellaceae bacterium]
MRVAVPKETSPGERRVALVPETVSKLGDGFQVQVERGAGAAAGFVDEAYADAGAELVDGSVAVRADCLVCVRSPSAELVASLSEGTVVIGFLEPLTDQDGIARLRERGAVAFAMESIPRITRAQSMDALSSQATVAGYKAVVLAADRVPRLFPMLMTAAGTIAPVRALVIGAGVAGLQAIATARRLGAVVSAFDVRPAVQEQVESLGAAFLDLGVRAEETAGGYATELTPEQQAQQQKALEERIPDFDVVVTTAAVPG